jgi:hypothetical protein
VLSIAIIVLFSFAKILINILVLINEFVFITYSSLSPHPFIFKSPLLIKTICCKLLTISGHAAIAGPGKDSV